MPETYFKKSGFTYSAWRTFPKSSKRIQKILKKELQNIFSEMN